MWQINCLYVLLGMVIGGGIVGVTTVREWAGGLLGIIVALFFFIPVFAIGFILQHLTWI